MHCRAADELLNETMFRSMAHARDLIQAWADDYNEERPHSALGYQTPKAFAERLFTMGRQQRCARCKLRSSRLLNLRQSAYQPKGL